MTIMDFMNTTDNEINTTVTVETETTTEYVWWTEAQIKDLSSDLWRYSAPVIFFLGTFGNITTMVVLRWRRSASETATTYFVQLVAAADLCFLVAGMFPQWMMLRNLADPMEDSPIGCKIYKFFLYSAGDVAVWYMAAFTVERFVSVYYPLQRATVCRISRIKLTAIVLVGLAVVKNVHVFWTRGAEWKLIDRNTTEATALSNNNSAYFSSNNSAYFSAYTDSKIYISENGERYELDSNCGYTTEEFKYFHLHVRVWIVFVLANVVPLVILIFCNSAVIWKLVHLRKGKGQFGGKSRYTSSAEAAAQQITIMCLVISLSFFVFIMPTMILLVGKPHFKTTPTTTAKYEIAQRVNNQLLFINHSINFYLYFVTCPSFRKQTVALFLCRKMPERVKSMTSGAPVQLTGYRSSAAPGQHTPTADPQTKSLLAPSANAIGTPV